MKKKFILISLLSFIIIFNCLPATITGNNYVEKNTTEGYTTSINVSAPYLYTWTVTNGTITGSPTGFGLRNINVNWTTVGTGVITLKIINTSNGSTFHLETYNVQVYEYILAYSYDASGNRLSKSLQLRLVLMSASDGEGAAGGTFNDPENNIMLWPNPTEGVIKIFVNREFEGDVHFHLYGADGSLLMENKHQDRFEIIDLESLSPGTYIIKIKAGEISVTKKIIKK